jgi:Flp pilus assembly protein CpaB
MKSRSIALILALVLAAIATTAVYAYVSGIEDQTLKGERTEPVLISTQTLKSGMSGNEILEAGAYDSKEVPVRYVLPGALATPEEISGLTLSDDIAAGEQITAQRFAESEQDAFFAEFPAGTEALSLPYEYLRGVASHMKAGDRVNAYMSVQDLVALYKQGQYFTKALRGSTDLTNAVKNARSLIQRANFLPGVKVLSLGNDGVILQIGHSIPVVETHAPLSGSNGSGPESAGDFTVAVTSQEAALLLFGQEKGTLWFTLVPQEDAQ